MALQKFERLCINDEHKYLAEDKRLLLQYVMDCYANIRGTYSVEFLNLDPLVVQFLPLGESLKNS